MAAGFETTAPTTASEIVSGPPENFSVLSCHRLIPPALKFLIESGEVNLNALDRTGACINYNWNSSPMKYSHRSMEYPK